MSPGSLRRALAASYIFLPWYHPALGTMHFHLGLGRSYPMDEPLLSLASRFQPLRHGRPYQWLAQSAQPASSSMYSSPPTCFKVLWPLGKDDNEFRQFESWFASKSADCYEDGIKSVFYICEKYVAIENM